jgi:hypothetical protein
VGLVADDHSQKIKLKMFHCEVQNDHKGIAREEAGYKEIPIVKRVSGEDVLENYNRIKREVLELLKQECEKLEIKTKLKKTKKQRPKPINDKEGKVVSH